MNYDHDYKTSYVEGPKGELQETHFDSRETLNLLRDNFDIPLSKFFNSGSPEQGIGPLSEQILTAFTQNQERYLVEGHLDGLTLISDVLPKSFEIAAAQSIFDITLAKRIFDIAGSEGIDTAISYVFNAKPFNATTTSESGKINVHNDRFKNEGLSHPETGEKLYKICPGFRVAQAIERQLVTAFRKILANPDVIDLDVTLPTGSSVGEMCKAIVNAL